MRHKIFLKILVDALMSALFLLALAHHGTGNLAHEIIGALLGALFIVHNILNWAWYKNLFRGPYTLYRGVWTVINLFLLAAMGGMLISGVLISRDVFDFLSVSGGWTARRWHTAAAYWGFILAGVHLGLHGSMITGWLGRRLGKWGQWAFGLFMLCLVLYGVKASFVWHIGSKLVLRRAFSSWEGVSLCSFIWDHFAIWCLYAAVSYYVSSGLFGWLGKKASSKKNKKESSAC